MRRVLCLCGMAQPLPLRTRLTLILHAAEVPTTTNTGRLATRFFPDSHVLLRGEKGVPFELPDPYADGLQPLLLYPTPQAEVLNSEFLRRFEGKRFHLLVPDGSWRQAAKVWRREKALADVPHITLPAGVPSEYRLRREPKAEGMATFEAIARAVALLEAPEHAEQMLHVFRSMVERVLWSRGLLHTRECKYPLPHAALAQIGKV